MYPYPAQAASSLGKKVRPGLPDREKNLLQYFSTCCKIKTRQQKQIRQDVKCYQHSTSLCRRTHLPHSKIFAPSVIIPSFVFVFKRGMASVCYLCYAVQGTPAPRFFCLSQRERLRGDGKGSTTPQRLHR